MTILFHKIAHSSSDFHLQDKDGNTVDYLALGKLNIFIGKNNSGKSRFLRHFLKQNYNDVKYGLSGELEDFLKSDLESFGNLDVNLNLTSLDTLAKKIAQNKYLFKPKEIHELKFFRDNFLAYQKEFSISFNRDTSYSNFMSLCKKYSKEQRIPFEYLKDLPENTPPAIYIPVLRGLRPVSQNGTHPYTHRTAFDYFRTGPALPYATYNLSHLNKYNGFISEIKTGEDLYEILKAHLLGKPEQRKLIKNFEQIISEIFFDRKEVTLIPHIDDDVVHIKIGNDDQFPIFELGDGLQQCLIIASTCYLQDSPAYIFIEEPETCLHPGYLLKLIDFLQLHTSHTYLLTTHSNHLLDLLDINSSVKVFKCNKIYSDEEDPEFRVTEISKDRSLLLDLGVKASSMLLGNCTIWVEGVTDRLYLRAFLKRYIAKLNSYAYKENYHYTIIEYQGGNLVHWDFDDRQEDEDHILSNMRALSSTIHPFLIADGDIQKKGDRVKKYTESLSDNFVVLGCKEIENMLPVEIVIATCEKLYGAMRREKYGKSINAISDGLVYEIYSQDTENGMGHYIDKALGLPKRTKDGRNRIFSSISGSLQDKKDFCITAVEIMESSTDWRMPLEIESFCEKIYHHIEKNNK